MQKLVGITPGPPDAEEDERGLPRRKAATTIDTATAEEDVKDFDVPEKNLTGFDQVLLLSTLCKQVRDEVQAQSKSLTSSSCAWQRLCVCFTFTS